LRDPLENPSSVLFPKAAKALKDCYFLPLKERRESFLKALKKFHMMSSPLSQIDATSRDYVLRIPLTLTDRNRVPF